MNRQAGSSIPCKPLFCRSKNRTRITNEKVFHLIKLRALADYKSNTAKIITSVFDRVGNEVGKGKKLDDGYFFLNRFPNRLFQIESVCRRQLHLR